MNRTAAFTLVAFLLAFGHASADTFVVRNTNNAGPGSLRQAILDANDRGGADIITFDIPGPGPYVITITSPLPPFDARGGVTVDGTTQPGYALRPLIGTGGTVGVDQLALPQLRSPIVQVFGNGLVGTGLVFTANDSTLRGLHVWGFTGVNVAFNNNNDAEVLENLIGANPEFGDPGPGLRAGTNLLLERGNKPSVRNNLVGYASGPENVLVTDQGGQILVEGNELVGSLRLSTETLLGSRDPTAQPLHFGQPDQELGQLRPRPPRWPDELHHQQQHGAQQRDWRGEYRGYPPDQHGERYVEDQCSRPEHRHRQPGAGHSRHRQSRRLESRQYHHAELDLPEWRHRDRSGRTNVGSAHGRRDDLERSQDTDDGGNALDNFPVIESATISGNSLIVSGWARNRAMMEFFADPPGSQGRTFIASAGEGTPQDSDFGIGAYGPGPINGISQGTDMTERFRFTIPLPPGLQAGSVVIATATDRSGVATRRSSAEPRRSRSQPMCRSRRPARRA